jgi:N-acyl amino acid synthase FeeM
MTCLTAPAKASSAEDVVQVARTADEREAIYRLRYDVFIAEMGKATLGADATTGQLTDQLDSTSVQLFVREGCEVTGACRLTFATARTASALGPSAQALALDRWVLGDEPISFSSRFAVRRRRRNSRVATALAVQSFVEGVSRGVVLGFLETNANLVPLYEHLGFRRYATSCCAPDGLLIPMVLVVADLEYLRSVSSPFLRVAEALAPDTRYLDRLLSSFPVVQEYYGAQTRRSVHSAITAGGVPGITVSEELTGLGIPEAIAGPLGRIGFVHRFGAGEVLARAGDLAFAAFVVLEGDVRVEPATEGRATVSVDVRAFGAECLDVPARSRSRVVCSSSARVLVVPAGGLRALARRGQTHVDAFKELFSIGGASEPPDDETPD